MKPQNNNATFNEGQINVPVYQQAPQDDEIDLLELVKVIWSYKWVTALICTVAIVGSVFYALTAQQWWVAQGKIIEPQLNDVGILYAHTEKIKTVIKFASEGNDNNEKTDANAKTSYISPLADLFIPETLFLNFINEFNSSLNKKQFLENNEVFLAFLKKNEIQIPTNEKTLENRLINQAYKGTLKGWRDGISASVDSKTKEATLSFRTDGQDTSAELLNQYINFVGNKVKASQLAKLSLFIDSSINELEVNLSMSEWNAKQSLDILTKKIEYAYQIASQSDLTEYTASLSNETNLFEVNLGAKALKAKLKVLKSLKDLNILDPNIAKMKRTLTELNSLGNVDENDFTPYRYLESVEAPLSRAKPKRALIVVLATLLAGMLSIAIALLHHFLTKKED